MEEEVKAAAVRFYDALEHLLTGKGVEPMLAAWHHTDRVTSGHPIGEWSRGWDEIAATWIEFARIGAPSMGGTQIRDLRAVVYGDVAYTTCVFVAAPSMGGAKMNCTNIFHRADGVWKVVHHHADRTPSVEAGIEKAALEAS